MIKSLPFLFVCLLFTIHCRSQDDHLKSKTTPNSANNTQNTTNANKGFGATPKDTITTPNVLLNVLFATNEDCDLYINEELIATVTKNEFHYQKLAVGNYTYKAKSKKTLDELKENFSIAEGRTNEIFIDLMYVVDERNAQRDSLRTTAKANTQPLELNEKKPADLKTVENKNEVNNDKETSIINFFIANMILLKGGSIIMGNNKAPSADEVEHPVTISPVSFSKYEVTQDQWESLMGYNPSINKGCATCPVENVSWEEVMKFIRKLNSISNKKFRLPTEAEWEFVAKTGGKTEIEGAGGQEEYIKQTAWYFGNSDRKTHPVGLKQPNVSGIYDLTGNVSEWCSDWYGTYYYKEDYNQKNPEGPALGKEKIIRGGNYKDFSGDRFRPSFRNKRNPIEKSGEVGFRLVMQLN